MKNKISFETNKSIFSLSSKPSWGKKWVLTGKKSIEKSIRHAEKKLLWAWYLKAHQLCTWPTLAQFSQHSYSAHFSQNWSLVMSTYFRQYCVLNPLWPSLVNTLTWSTLAQLGQSGLSTQYCLKWAEYHHWPLLARLGQVRVLAKLGQSGPSAELAGFKYQAQNIFSSVRFRARRKKWFLDLQNSFFFLYGGSELVWKKKKSCFSWLLRTGYLKII